MRAKVIGAVAVAFLLCAGCATIPKESIDLSIEIGKGISESRRAHVNHVNAYFLNKRNLLEVNGPPLIANGVFETISSALRRFPAVLFPSGPLRP